MDKNNICTKKELAFYIKADYMMGHGKWKPSFITRIKEIIFPNRIYEYLVFMRKANYYSHFSPLSLRGGGNSFTINGDIESLGLS